MNRQCSWHTVGAQHICGVNVCVHVHIRSSKEGDREQKGQSVCPKHFRNVIWSTPCLWATGPTRVLWDFFFFSFPLQAETVGWRLGVTSWGRIWSLPWKEHPGARGSLAQVQPSLSHDFI